MNEIEIDKLVYKLEQELIEEYNADKFITLGDLDVMITKFSNVTLGTNDVKYALISTQNIEPEGTVNLLASNVSMRDSGSLKGIEKYKVHKGDIVFPHNSLSFNVAGVVMQEPAFPCVGNHGMMKISCGADNLDLAFMIKDYLQLSAVGRFVSTAKITVPILEMLPIPIVNGQIFNYQEPSIKIKRCKAKVKEIESALILVEEKLQLNAFKGEHDANKDLTNNINSALAYLTEALKSVKSI